MPQIVAIDVLKKAAAAAPRQPLSPLRARLRGEALALARAEALVDARASYRIVPLTMAEEGGRLCLDGETLEAPWLLPASGTLTAVACAVCTLGGALERRVSNLFAERRAALAVALDALANELLFVLSRQVQDRIFAETRKMGLTMAGELRAGDPGLALAAQGTVLRLADGAAIGVRVTSGGMMHPVKSTSLVQGVGLALPAANWSRCDHCPSRARCAVATQAASA